VPEHQTGTTTDFALTRNEIIDLAYAKIGKLAPGASLNEDQLGRGIKALNLIIKREDNKMIEKNKALWANQTDHLILIDDKIIYGVQEGLSPSILRLHGALFRGVDGDDKVIDILTRELYEAKIDKNTIGDPSAILFVQGVRPKDNEIWVYPHPDSIGTTSAIVGSDSKLYQCIQTHTSDPKNKPINGTDWPLFWRLGGTGTTAWVTATDYTNGELIRYTFRQPLFEFNKHDDNPDMPLGWDNFLIYTLAFELAPEPPNPLPLDDRRWLGSRARSERADLFPIARQPADQTAHYNKVEYF